MENKNFYCYSNKMRHFIQSFDIPFTNVGMNKNTNAKYWIFVKSSRLDKVIKLYNLTKHLI